MVPYHPKGIDPDVNISNRSPLREFALLMVAFICFIVAVYLSLGLAVDWVAETISVEDEQALLSSVSGDYSKLGDPKSKETPEAIGQMQERADRLLKSLPPAFMSQLPPYTFSVTVVPHEQVNAMALPGGNILILSGLIRTIETDDELLFVIGHELGHFANRDHLKGLGRKLVFVFMSIVMTGTDSGLSSLFSGTEAVISSQHSQGQEYAADDWGLKALKATNRSYEGGIGFMNKIGKGKDAGRLARWSKFMSSHPHAKDRAARILNSATK